MRKIIFNILSANILIAGTLFLGCQSSDHRDSNSMMQENQQEMNESHNGESAEMVNSEEWKTFKTESEAKIRDNEIRMEELKEEMKTSGAKLDASFEKRIKTLERKNKDMKIRIETYEKDQSDWKTFKREFNHDMESLGQALKGFWTENKN